MAERSNATSKKNQDAAQDVGTLQKRGRRRLVGAVALVLLAVIILPMVFDPEPRQDAPAVSIRIPNEEGTKFTPKAAVPQPAPSTTVVAEAPKPPATAPVTPEPPKLETKPEPKADNKADNKVESKAAEKKTAPAAPKPVEKAAAAAPASRPPEKAAPAPAATSEKFVVQIGAFASADKIREVTDQLKEAKLAHYMESVPTAKGAVTRIRLGPYDSKEAAEKARDRAKGLGLTPANPISK